MLSRTVILRTGRTVELTLSGETGMSSAKADDNALAFGTDTTTLRNTSLGILRPLFTDAELDELDSELDDMRGV